MRTGLTVARDLQLGGYCQRSDCCVVRCSDSPLWLVRCLSRLVLHATSRLNFLLLRLNTNFSASRDVGHLMIDLECKESQSRFVVVCGFLLAPSAVASGKLTLPLTV